MKFLVDHNLSPRLAEHLGSLGHEATHVRDLSLHKAPDAEAIEAAREGGCVLISADSDFPTMLALSGAATPSVIYVTGSYPSEPARLALLISNQIPAITQDLLDGAVIAIDGHQIRIRPLPITKE